MRLQNFKPARNYVLLELKQYNKIGEIITPNSQTDKVMTVLATGEGCELVKVGDKVLMDDRPMIQLGFEPVTEGGKQIICLLGQEFNIIATYAPDPDETQYYIPQRNPKPLDLEKPRNLNVIDNPGVEDGPYLKEEFENLEDLKNSI